MADSREAKYRMPYPTIKYGALSRGNLDGLYNRLKTFYVWMKLLVVLYGAA